MMDAGLALQCHDATIHYCDKSLQDFSNLVASAWTYKSRVQGCSAIEIHLLRQHRTTRLTLPYMSKMSPNLMVEDNPIENKDDFDSQLNEEPQEVSVVDNPLQLLKFLEDP